MDNYQRQIGDYSSNLEAYNRTRYLTSACARKYGWSERQRFSAFAYVILTLNGRRAREAYRIEQMPSGLPEEIFHALTPEEHSDLSQARMTDRIMSVLKPRLIAGYPQIMTIPVEDTRRKSASLSALLTSLELDMNIQQMFNEKEYHSTLLDKMMTELSAIRSQMAGV